jgi:fatty acid metabolism transcriptional regulator FadR
MDDTFTPVERRHLASLVAQKLRELILQGKVKPGQRLPPERQLATLLNVTRTTLREALKMLETWHFVVIRQGDGVRVQDYLRSANIEILSDLLFRDGKIDGEILQNILEAREIFGKTVARLAANRATKEEIERYAEIVGELISVKDDARLLQEKDFECFDALCHASHNLVFVFVLNAIRSIYFRNMDCFAGIYSDKERFIKGHTKLLEALRNKDQNGAEEAAMHLLCGAFDTIGKEAR